MTTPGYASDSRDRSSGLLLGLALAVLAALLLVPLARAWNLAADIGHGWAAPVLMVYLWWERWPDRPKLRVRNPGPGLWLMLLLVTGVALPLRLVLTPYPLWPMALLIYVAALVALALSAAWLWSGRDGLRWLGGPLLMLVAVLPWPGGVERTFIMPLREGIAAVVAEISNLAGHPALASGTSVRLAGGWVGIDEACGGIRSLQASILIALFFGEWLRLGWTRRMGLLLGGAGAAIVGNFGRVLFLSWAAGQGTLERWHDPAGWAGLGFSLTATGLLGWWLRPRSAHDRFVASRARVIGAGAASLSISWRAWLICMVVMLGAIELVTRAWYAWGEAKAANVPQWTVNFPETNPTLRRLPLTESAREMLRPDIFESVSWRGPGQLECMANYIVWEQGQMARSAPFLHNPTTCLPYSGCELVEDLGLLVVRWQNGEIPFRTYVFRRMNEDLIVAFALWDPVQGKPLLAQEGGWGGWWRAQWRDVMAARQHQPGQMLAFAMVGREHQDRLGSELARLIVPVGELNQN